MSTPVVDVDPPVAGLKPVFPYGGSISGDGRFVSPHIESFCLYIAWLVMLWLSPLWEKMPSTMTRSVNPETRGADKESGPEQLETGPSEPVQPPSTDPGRFGSGGHTLATRLTNVTRGFRDAFLITLATVMISMAGYGVDHRAMAVMWTLFAVSFVWALSQALPHKLSVAMDIL
ncbi:hypothetical protein HDU76_007314, partial [Blyttiomyces sp. JEL0837]